MRRSALILLVAWVLADGAFAQPVPKRSEELCGVLKESSVEKGLEFTVTRPGACRAGIDKGYTLTVNYTVGDDEPMLHVGLMVDAVVLGGDASAFWLRLSALDNLSHLALGTKQQAVFDEFNKLSKRVAKEILPLLKQGRTDVQKKLFGKAQRATILATGTADGLIFLQASAYTKNIDRMKDDRKMEASGQISGWRKVLVVALQAFAAGAKGYGEAYRAHYENPRRHRVTSCYTNFAGQWAFTHCY